MVVMLEVELELEETAAKAVISGGQFGEHTSECLNLVKGNPDVFDAKTPNSEDSKDGLR